MKQMTGESYGWQLRASALMVAGLAIAGCTSPERTDNTTPPLQTSEPLPTLTADTTPPAVAPPEPAETNTCTAVEVPVFPGSRLSQDNADSIQKQLEALTVAKTPSAEVGLRTLFNANAIITNALVDNQYAEAFTSVAERPASDIPDAMTLLSQTYSGADQQCLTRDQLQDVDNLNRILVEGLGPQVGRQLSSAAQVAYDSLRSNYEKFQERYREELATR